MYKRFEVKSLTHLISFAYENHILPVKLFCLLHSMLLLIAVNIRLHPGISLSVLIFYSVPGFYGLSASFQLLVALTIHQQRLVSLLIERAVCYQKT
jgi:hypothetical protein